MGWQVGLNLGHKELVDLVLGSGLSAPSAGEHLDLSVLALWDLVRAFHNFK